MKQDYYAYPTDTILLATNVTLDDVYFLPAL